MDRLKSEKMKSVTLIIAMNLFISLIGFGQVVNDITSAKAIALSDNKLIIIDFWATWCKPCLDMDKELWQNKEFEKVNNKFVLLKLDITENRDLAIKYGITSIPHVIISTANEDRLLEEKGYKNANYYLEIFNSFPCKYEELNQKLVPFMDNNTATSNDMYNLGDEFRKIGMNIAHKYIKGKFLSKSKYYFKKCEKTTNSEELKKMAILSQLRIDAYLKKHKKVRKKLGKLEFKNQSAEVSEMIKFILAFCYKNEGNLEEMSKVKDKIENQELLMELE